MRRSWPDGTFAASFQNVPACGLAAACMRVPARRPGGDATAPRVRVTREDAGRSYRAGGLPRAPRFEAHPAVPQRSTHGRRRGPRAPGHNTNE
jgi:hypothetical protein